MSRFEFTDGNGYLVATIEARNATEARAEAVSRHGAASVRHCAHLSDDHAREGIDPIFYLGPGVID